MNSCKFAVVSRCIVLHNNDLRSFLRSVWRVQDYPETSWNVLVGAFALAPCYALKDKSQDLDPRVLPILLRQPSSFKSNSFLLVQIRPDRRIALPSSRRTRFFRKGTDPRIGAAAFLSSHDVQVPAANRYETDQSHKRLAYACCFGAKKTDINR